MSRLEELFEKARKTPLQMTMEEARELQSLARADRATVGQTTARKQRAAASGKKKAPVISLDDLEKKLKEMQTLQQIQSPTTT